MESVWNAYGIRIAPKTVRIESLTQAHRTEPFNRRRIRPRIGRRAIEAGLDVSGKRSRAVNPPERAIVDVRRNLGVMFTWLHRSRRSGMFGRRGFVLGVAAGGLVALIGLGAPTFAQADVTVFAAASLKNALDDVSAAWTIETGRTATISYAASSALAKQIEEGAPADLYISADLDWMAYLSERNLIRKDSEVRLLGNRIVLIAPADSTARAEIAPGLDLAALLGDGRLAMANVDAVPAGRYGKAALQWLGAWDGVAEKLAQAENVRAALALVAIGEAPLGIVYATDAAADPSVKIIGTFPEDSHPPIVYPAAVTADAKSPDAAAYLAYLQSEKAAGLFEAQGFTVLAPAP
jgi:molybdate transport system substrate-binding protein